MEFRVMLLGMAALLTLGCQALDLFGPEMPADRQSSVDFVEDGIRVMLTVTPGTLDPPGTVLATLSYENLGSETVALHSAYGCVSFAAVYRGEHRISFPSTDYGCTAAFASRDLEPGVPLTVDWPLEIGGAEGVQAGPGTYRFVAELTTHDRPLAHTFVVR